MNCEACKERLPEYVLGELDATTRDEVERALAECPECRSEEAKLRRIFASAEAAPRLDFDETRRAVVLARAHRVAARLARRQDPPWYAHPSFLMAASALLAVGATVALLQLRGDGRNDAAEQATVARSPGMEEAPTPIAPAAPSIEEGRAVNEGGLTVSDDEAELALPVAAAAPAAELPAEVAARGPAPDSDEQAVPTPVQATPTEPRLQRSEGAGRGTGSAAATAASPMRSTAPSGTPTFAREAPRGGGGAAAAEPVTRTASDRAPEPPAAPTTGLGGIDAVYGAAPAAPASAAAAAPAPPPSPAPAIAPAPAQATAVDTATLLREESAEGYATETSSRARQRRERDARSSAAPAAEAEATPDALADDNTAPLDAGISLYRAARYAEAASLLDHLVSSIPADDPRAETAQYHLGAALFELGELRRARHVLVRLLDRYPRSTYADNARDLLARIDRADAQLDAPAAAPAPAPAPATEP